MDDRFYMNIALEEARVAFLEGEAPIGAVITMDDEIISRAHNRRENDKNALFHAETMAIDLACKRLGGWRLHKCTLYVTLEPCVMCAGAIINSRIKRVVYGAKDAKAGAFGSVINLNTYPLNHKPEIVCGVCGSEAASLMSDFFSKIRENRKK